MSDPIARRDLTDDELARLAADLEALLHGREGFHEPPRLFGLASADPLGPGCAHLPAAGGRVWERLAVGDPYAFLDEVEVDPDRTPALALVVNGWASPSDGRLPGVRPSRHPDRMRVRSVVVVTPDGRQMTALRRRGAGAEPWLDGSGDGPMMRALQWVWWRHPAA